MENPKEPKYYPIESYGIIGDLETVALVGMHGSIDFMCYPRFDSPTIFAALLDAERGGRFELGPILTQSNRKQLYLPDSNVLLSRFLSDEGVAEISDFMHLTKEGADGVLIRRVKTVHGEIKYRMRCAPRFDYARRPHRLLVDKDGYRGYFDCLDTVQPDLYLHSTVKMTADGDDAIAEFVLPAGHSATFMLEMARPEELSPHLQPPLRHRRLQRHPQLLAQMDQPQQLPGPLARNRQPLRPRPQAPHLPPLRLHHRQPHLRPTRTSRRRPQLGLPLHLDPRQLIHPLRSHAPRLYRRSPRLYALARKTLRRKQHQLRRAPAHVWHRRPPQTHRSHPPKPRRLQTLPARPHRQRRLQPDPARYLRRTHGLRLSVRQIRRPRQLRHVAGSHPNPRLAYRKLANADHGIWEVRGGQREFLYTRVMNWVALDRGVRLAMKRSLPAPLDKWSKARNDIYQDVFQNFWNDDLQAFVQSKGSNVLDAACLVMPLVRFIGPRDPRWLSTMKAVEAHLLSDSLVYRYLPPGEKKLTEAHVNPMDGITGTEGTFSMCSFWYVECLSRSGDLHQARFLFEKMLGYANHLGLFGEELGPKGEQLGNFPQAFTHLALISAAFDLNRRLDDAGVVG